MKAFIFALVLVAAKANPVPEENLEFFSMDDVYTKANCYYDASRTLINNKAFLSAVTDLLTEMANAPALNNVYSDINVIKTNVNYLYDKTMEFIAAEKTKMNCLWYGKDAALAITYLTVYSAKLTSVQARILAVAADVSQNAIGSYQNYQKCHSLAQKVMALNPLPKFLEDVKAC